jgi:cobalamin biosynthesis protein CobT
MMRSYDEWMNGRKTSGKEVDVLAYAGRVINNFHVFKSKSIRQCVNTTVHLLVDASGSMAALCPDSNIRRYEVANQVALSLALGMENISNLTSR